MPRQQNYNRPSNYEPPPQFTNPGFQTFAAPPTQFPPMPPNNPRPRPPQDARYYNDNSAYFNYGPTPIYTPPMQQNYPVSSYSYAPPPSNESNNPPQSRPDLRYRQNEDHTYYLNQRQKQ